jgi:hypothetical protein
MIGTRKPLPNDRDSLGYLAHVAGSEPKAKTAEQGGMALKTREYTRYWLTTADLVQMTGYTTSSISYLARKGKIPGRRISTRGCTGRRFPDTPVLREWIALMRTIKRARKEPWKARGGVEASKALMNFRIAYARRAPLEEWPLDLLQQLEHELAEILKIHGDLCRAIATKQQQ